MFFYFFITTNLSVYYLRLPIPISTQSICSIVLWHFWSSTAHHILAIAIHILYTGNSPIIQTFTIVLYDEKSWRAAGYKERVKGVIPMSLKMAASSRTLSERLRFLPILTSCYSSSPSLYSPAIAVLVI